MSGCSGGNSEHGHVTGVLKINGSPASDVMITFSPVAGGRSAVGYTEADGSYELTYTPGVKGAKIGVNQIILSTYEEPELGDDDKIKTPAIPERFPPEYNSSPSVTHEVKSGENVFDFDIKTTTDSYPPPQDS